MVVVAQTDEIHANRTQKSVFFFQPFQQGYTLSQFGKKNGSNTPLAKPLRKFNLKMQAFKRDL